MLSQILLLGFGNSKYCNTKLVGHVLLIKKKVTPYICKSAVGYWLELNIKNIKSVVFSNSQLFYVGQRADLYLKSF